MAEAGADLAPNSSSLVPGSCGLAGFELALCTELAESSLLQDSWSLVTSACMSGLFTLPDSWP